MLFNTVHFFVFLAAVLLLYYLAPPGPNNAVRKWILLAASYFFYMSWNPKFIALLLALTVTDYLAAFWIERSQDNGTRRFTQNRRKIFLVLGLSANLGFLGFFKYYNFLGDNIGRLLHLAPHALALPIILPLGISFHTFQSMSYLIDVYRGEQEVIRNPLDYALFIAFFPQLVAGPIVRAREFFKDLYHWRAPVDQERLRGVLLLLTGLVKKMAFADRFALLADSYFSSPGAHPGSIAAWTGAIAFALQIFFDFSGYTDMAIGMALLLGFHFPENFRRPYLAFSITDFWHRWHMTLSRWLRDYLYIPLGGNRHGELMTYRNLMLTMLLGGLWHGASWNFVIWGGYHGVLLSIERLIGRRYFEQRPAWWLYPIRVAFTFGLATLGWVFFRAVNFNESRYVLGQMFSSIKGAGIEVQVWLIWLAAFSLLVAIAEERWSLSDRLPRSNALAYGAAIVILLFMVELFGVTDRNIPFVYFQF